MVVRAPNVTPSVPALSRLSSGVLQSKLSIGSIDDPLEHEADAAAEQVMRVPERAVSLSAGVSQVSRQCTACEDEEGKTLQTKRAGTAKVPAEAPPIVGQVLREPGQPLDAKTRAFFEPRFGCDFSRVRIHTDSRAAESARLVNAQAYAVGPHIGFATGRFAPASGHGRRLLAHELAHVVQQGNARARGAHMVRRAAADAGDTTKPAVDASADAAVADAAAGVDTAALAPPQVTPAGHAVAPQGMAACPDAPPRSIVVVGCVTAPAAAPPAVEKAVLPTLNPARFGGDADRAKFAEALAQCHAERVVKDEIDKRYRAAVAAAKSKATEESKHDTEEALKAAVVGIDPKDRGALTKARTRAGEDAKKVAAKKIADAQTAVTREDVATVTAQLATKFEEELANDFDETMKGALNRYGASWLRTMQAALNAKRKQITKDKNTKPKVAKDQTPPEPKSADEIAREIEIDMVQVRCDQTEWALQQIESVAHAWAVGRREQVDFETIAQTAAFLKNFAPTYVPADQDRVDIPIDLQQEKGMPGVAPETSDFLAQLKADPATPSFKASNYGGHGGGHWAGKGFSVDLFVNAPTDQRGFWQHDTAVTFLLRLDAAAKALGARWRVLYNDFRVAQEVNAATGTRNVEFMGESGGGKLNWHGPAPLILHFHLDLEIPQKRAAAQGTPVP
jgi:hypothetical protein